MKKAKSTEPAQRSARERIISAAMTAFMEQGYAKTSTLEIATRAKVSKREIYSEFGGKEGILAECIAHRSSRIKPPADLKPPKSREDLAQLLVHLGANQLKELSDPQVTAVFRLAIGEARSAPQVARTLDEHGRGTARGMMRQLFTAAQAARLLDGDVAKMSEDYLALLWGDVMVGLLLGVAKPIDSREAEKRAKHAVEAFFKVYPE